MARRSRRRRNDQPAAPAAARAAHILCGGRHRLPGVVRPDLCGDQYGHGLCPGGGGGEAGVAPGPVPGGAGSALHRRERRARPYPDRHLAGRGGSSGSRRRIMTEWFQSTWMGYGFGWFTATLILILMIALP